MVIKLIDNQSRYQPSAEYVRCAPGEFPTDDEIEEMHTDWRAWYRSQLERECQRTGFAFASVCEDEQ